MSEPTSALLTMRGIRKSFFGQEVLRGVDLELIPGQIRALVGHNGAGKSTLIKILAGIHQDYSGDITLEGKPLRVDSPGDAQEAGIAVIHQEFALVPGFDVAQNLALGREPRRMPGVVAHDRIQKQARQTLQQLAFTIPQGVPVGELSVAHQQLTEIAKALSLDAKILIMDEPTARLAPAEREALFAVIRQLAAQGVAIVYISHFLEEVLDVTDAVTVLRDGSVVDDRPSDQHTLQTLTDQIIGTVPQAALPATAKATIRAEASGIENIDPVAVGEPTGTRLLSLEDFGPVGHPTVNLEAYEGEVVGIAGLVGSGRTELLEAIMGARRSHGKRLVAEKSVRIKDTYDAVRHGLAMVPEDRKSRGLIMERNAQENIVLSALTNQFSTAGFVNFPERSKAYKDAVERFRVLSRDLDAPVRTLSGGNQQKVLLARAATVRPRVLLLDQPTAGVDIGAKKEIYQHIARMVQGGATCIVVSDELEELLTICDRIAVIRAGHIASVRPARSYDESSLLADMSKTFREEAEERFSA